MNFIECEDMIACGRNGRKKLANNTYLERLDDNTFGVLLHKTHVVMAHRNGTYTLNSGGWQTATTKARINEYSPAKLFQRNGIWYVGDDIYFDGCKVDQSGAMICSKVDRDDTEKKKKKLDRLVTKYINGFASHVLEHGLKKPSSSDCWYCFLKPDSNHDGCDWGGYDHIACHIAEGYYVPSLLANAIAERRPNAAVIWMLIENDIKHGRSDLLKRELRAFLGKRKHHILKHIESALADVDAGLNFA